MCTDKVHEKKKGGTITGNDIHCPSQTNHDACFIPESVRQYTGEPLYILVAHWCMQQRGWVQRNQISVAFHIPARRASYLVAYLRNKARRVVCETRECILVNKISRYEIYVTRVTDSSPPGRAPRSPSPRPPAPRHRGGNADTHRANELWNQLCLRRHAGQEDAGDD